MVIVKRMINLNYKQFELILFAIMSLYCSRYSTFEHYHLIDIK